MTELGRELIGDPSVSRRHARISQNGNGYVIEDLQSSNGTYVDGRRITSPTVLMPGAQVGLGPAQFYFLIDGPAAGGRRPTI